MITVLLLGIAGSAAFGWAFDQVGTRAERASRRKELPNAWLDQKGLPTLLLVLFALDVVLRLRLVLAGAQFAWLVESLENPVAQGIFSDPWFQIQSALWPAVVVIAVYLAIDRTHRGAATAVLAVEAVAVLATGQRYGLLLFAALCGLTYLIRRPLDVRRVVISTLLAVVLLLVVIGPAIQAARYAITADSASFQDDPSLIAGRFLTEYLPDALFGESGNYASPVEAQASYRIASTVAYASTVHERILETRSLLPFTNMIETLQVTIPSALLPGKGVVDADAVVQAYYSFGTPGRDTAGSALTDAMAHGHAVAVVVLFAVGGLVVGAGTRAIGRRSPLLAALLLVSAMPAFIPLGDSFSAYLAGLRNHALVVTAATALLAWLYRRTRPSRATRRVGTDSVVRQITGPA